MVPVYQNIPTTSNATINAQIIAVSQQTFLSSLSIFIPSFYFEAAGGWLGGEATHTQQASVVQSGRWAGSIAGSIPEIDSALPICLSHHHTLLAPAHKSPPEDGLSEEGDEKLCY